MRKGEVKKNTRLILSYIFLCILGIIMVYPLLWMFSASFKTNNEIFSSFTLIPKKIVTGAYSQGWKGSGQYSFGRFFSNTFIMVLPTVFFTIISSLLVAYGFARFKFRYKKTFVCTGFGFPHATYRSCNNSTVYTV